MIKTKQYVQVKIFKTLEKCKNDKWMKTEYQQHIFVGLFLSDYFH